MPNTTNKLIHIAKILPNDRNAVYLLLRKKADYHYHWHAENADKTETETLVSATTLEEALQLAYREWKSVSFRTVNCGFRYTLPERDEHGMNALFHQMVSSYASSNGQYFDEDLGHMCIVHNASQEARDLALRLK